MATPQTIPSQLEALEHFASEHFPFDDGNRKGETWLSACRVGDGKFSMTTTFRGIALGSVFPFTENKTDFSQRLTQEEAAGAIAKFALEHARP